MKKINEKIITDEINKIYFDEENKTSSKSQIKDKNWILLYNIFIIFIKNCRKLKTKNLNFWISY